MVSPGSPKGGFKAKTVHKCLVFGGGSLHMPGVGCFLGYLFASGRHRLRGACVLSSLLGMVGIDTCVGRSASLVSACTRRAATGREGGGIWQLMEDSNAS